MAHITLVVPVFPKLSETFIVNKFLGLLERGHDVRLVVQQLDLAAWAHFPQLKTRPELARRVCVRGSSSKFFLLRLGALLAQVVGQTPYRAFAYIWNGSKAIGWNVLRTFFRDLPVIATAREIVHFEFGTLATEAARTGRWLGCKVVTSFRGYDLNYVGLEEPGYYDEVWKSTDAVHCLGEDLWRRALRRGCPQTKPHALIPPAIDTEYFKPANRDYPHPVGTAGRPLRVLSVGRLEWKKGYEYALAAIRLLLDQGIAAEYRIVGTGEYLEAVMFCRHQLGLEDQVTVAGAAPPAVVKSHLEWADVFLHAAVSEGFCNAVLEAQAMELPVVTTDADGLAENVQDGVTGFVVRRRDPRALAERLARLAADAGLRARLGAAGRKRVVEQFQLPRQIDAFERLYQEVLLK